MFVRPSASSRPFSGSGTRLVPHPATAHLMFDSPPFGCWGTPRTASDLSDDHSRSLTSSGSRVCPVYATGCCSRDRPCPIPVARGRSTGVLVVAGLLQEQPRVDGELVTAFLAMELRACAVPGDRFYDQDFEVVGWTARKSDHADYLIVSVSTDDAREGRLGVLCGNDELGSATPKVIAGDPAAAGRLDHRRRCCALRHGTLVGPGVRRPPGP